jgi:hypothetical protein
VNAEQWNALYPVGTPVFAYPGARPPKAARKVITRTRSRAWVASHGKPVVMVDDLAGWISLTHVDVVTEDEFNAAKTADAVAAEGALPMPAGPEVPSDADLRAENERLRRDLDRAREDVAFLERATLPELRREVEHHKAGKQRWRERAEAAETERDALQKRLRDAAMTRTWRNEDGKKFVFVEDIAPALLGIDADPKRPLSEVQAQLRQFVRGLDHTEAAAS